MLPRTPPALAALLARVSRTELTPGSACRAGTLCRPVARGSARASPSPSPSPPAHIATALARRHPRRLLVRASPPPSPSPSPWTAGGAGAASPRGRALSLAPLATRHPAAQTATARAEGRAAAHPRLSHRGPALISERARGGLFCVRKVFWGSGVRAASSVLLKRPVSTHATSREKHERDYFVRASDAL